ncbi:MAG: hypothetical protein E7Z91_03810 [Cyanobacteria bacterium SIG30]|nr:hypothetical protein [Cyanobacteria bacterium SIG30]
MALETMQVFKHLPAAKKAENSNCKQCGCPTCMAFALKLSKGNIEISKCPYVSEELLGIVTQANKIQQKTVVFDNVKIGGETVFSRHEKTFINPTGIFVSLDSNDKEKLDKIYNFEIESVGKTFKIDGVFLTSEDKNIENELKNNGYAVIYEKDLSLLQEVKEDNIYNMIEKIDFIRKKSIIERDEKYSNPVFSHLKEQNPYSLCAKMTALISRCASLIIVDLIDEAVLTTNIILRQNIFTDPEKPLQVESKLYEFNNPDENAHVFLTTNFALTYFAVANELSTIKNGSYLVITPSEGMSVLTAWSAEKITAQIAAKVVNGSEELKKIKNKKIILPGLLADLKEELNAELPEWEIVIGPCEAYKLPDFVKNGY